MEVARVSLQVLHVCRLWPEGRPRIPSSLWIPLPLLLVSKERVLFDRHRGGEDEKDTNAQVGDPTCLRDWPRHRGASRCNGHHGLLWQMRGVALNPPRRRPHGGRRQRCQRASRLPRLRLHRANCSHHLPPNCPFDATLWSSFPSAGSSPQSDCPSHGSLLGPFPFQQSST